MRSVLPWLALVAMAIIIGWLAQEQTDLQKRIAALEGRGQSGVGKVMSLAAADGPESSEPLGAPEARRQLGEMRDAIQSLHTELADARQAIAREAEERAATTVREELLACHEQSFGPGNFGQPQLPQPAGCATLHWRTKTELGT
jgi:hypothetical protein